MTYTRKFLNKQTYDWTINLPSNPVARISFPIGSILRLCVCVCVCVCVFFVCALPYDVADGGG